MRFLDPRSAKNPFSYVLQCGLVGACVLILLALLDVKRDGAVIACLGASAFIAFAMPQKRTAAPRILIGGYVMALVAAFLCSRAAVLPFVPDPYAAVGGPVYALLAGLTVALAVIWMSITNTEHPPAAGLALGLFISGCAPRPVIVAMAGICVLSAAKAVLKPYLKDLV